MTERFSDPMQPSAASGDQLVTPERSVFGTRVPRPTGVGRHLVVVVILSLFALGIAIGFAEGGEDTGSQGPQKTRFQRSASP